MTMDARSVRVLIVVVGLTVWTCVIGTLVLSGLGRAVPTDLATLAGTGLGALVGLLVPSPITTIRRSTPK